MIVDFTFKDGWYPATDGSGRSLVARDPAGTSPDAFGEAEAWAISLAQAGSPGAADPEHAQAYFGWDNFHFTSLERDDPLVSGPDADPDGDTWSNLLEYALGGNPRVPDGGLVEFCWATHGGRRHAALRHAWPVHALDLHYDLLASNELASSAWPVVGAMSQVTSPAAGGLEEVVRRELSPALGSGRFLRLEVKLVPPDPGSSPLNVHLFPDLEAREIHVQWGSSPGEHYTLEWSTSSTGWSPLATGIPAQGTRTTFTDSLAARFPARLPARMFYRLTRDP